MQSDGTLHGAAGPGGVARVGVGNGEPVDRRHEEAADTLSARWFDKEAMRKVLWKLRVDARTLPNASQRQRAIKEIDARIEALQ